MESLYRWGVFAMRRQVIGCVRRLVMLAVPPELLKLLQAGLLSKAIG